MPIAAALKQLSAALPELDFRSDTDLSGWLDSAAVVRYLDYYHINFRAEGLCGRHRFGKFLAAGFHNAVHIWQPESPVGTVFVVHGFTDHVGLMQHPLRFLLKRRFNVVAFDLPGHGLSSGFQASIDSFDQYRDVLTVCLRRSRAVLEKPWLGVGQSTGGAVWMNYFLTYLTEYDVESAFLGAPLVRPTGWRYLRLAFPAVRAAVNHLPRRFKNNSHDEQFLQFLQYRDPLQTRVTPMRWADAMNAWIKLFQSASPSSKPLVIAQGDDDTTVDYRYNVKVIASKFPHCTVAMLAGARHQLFNESEPIRHVLFSHMSRWLNSAVPPSR